MNRSLRKWETSLLISRGEIDPYYRRGGGSIGAELCRQVAVQDPSLIIILDHDENAVYEINRELKYRYPSVKTYPVVADIRNCTRVDGGSLPGSLPMLYFMRRPINTFR